ncbi:MAG: hypothetical protein DSO07_08495 [Thermoproteota archaeon]|jgi:hypothetical protein|uniref:Uncharacterized protein n=1 Tax=Candidatus Methanodesulfokora washburnensis TaxID=2478471 RepID=A0A3R9X0H9_9CREN|nr:hypothetical protein [Candidatus Methanodesulfokores washburnensis]RSN72300.1 hypothetical protein D6D85_14270 [Candidatus Methanodesulfokores washburnensis]RZN61659.1 MAG: hypothetical protein EF810_04585 [Candidatus Methanodesulfokores washburnensis]TDA40687.1 MAG: hypothetical protein DSO07_08495 [Candidatus Korarchaeota archaeon]
MTLMGLSASWRRIWIYYVVLIVILILCPYWLPGRKTIIEFYAEHVYELILYIILCIVLLIPISYVSYIALRDGKSILLFIIPLSVMILGLLPYISFYYKSLQLLCISTIIFFFTTGGILVGFLMKWGTDEAMQRKVGYWAPKSWKYTWILLFFFTNLVLFSDLLLFPLFNPRYMELTLIYTKHIHILILYIIFCAILLALISRMIQFELGRTRFWRGLFFSISSTTPFILSFLLIVALTHGAVREAFTGYLIGALISAPMLAFLAHFVRE